MERYTAKVLNGNDRPRRVYNYYVTGRGPFPVDMLRHDACWPAGPEDATRLLTEEGERSIRFTSHRPPEPDRWWSFGWSVGNERLF